MKENKIILNLEDLPKIKSKIDWENSIGTILFFNYNGIKGSFKIIKYKSINKKPHLTVIYNNEEYVLTSNQIRNGILGRVFGFLSNRHSLKIGQEYNNLLIIDTFYRKTIKKNKRYKNGFKEWEEPFYKYKCLKCDYIGEISESNLFRNQGCSCCNGKIVVKGINDIGTTHPWLIPYIVDKEIIHKLSAGSNKRIKFKCPYCGMEKESTLNHITRLEYFPCLCNDKGQYPEKFVFYILNELFLNELIWQFTKTNSEWVSGGIRYDFYFKYNNEEYIIEVNGEQHYRYTGFKRTLEEEQANDKYKYELAIENGIKPENYITIDFRESTLEWGKEHILDSRLNEIFDLSSIDWEKCEEFARNSLYKQIVKLYNSGAKLEDICNITQKCKDTVKKYLTLGNTNGLCIYNSSENKKEKIPVRVSIGEEIIGEYESYLDLSNHSVEIFGKYLGSNTITNIINKNKNQLYKKKWKIEKITLND